MQLNGYNIIPSFQFVTLIFLLIFSKWIILHVIGRIQFLEEKKRLTVHFVLFTTYTGQISSNQSLFTYPPGKTASYYMNSTFVPAFVAPCTTDVDRMLGQQTCGTNQNCYFDYCITKDVNIAIATKEFEALFHQDQATLSEISLLSFLFSNFIC